MDHDVIFSAAKNARISQMPLLKLGQILLLADKQPNAYKMPSSLIFSLNPSKCPISTFMYCIRPSPPRNQENLPSDPSLSIALSFQAVYQQPLWTRYVCRINVSVHRTQTPIISQVQSPPPSANLSHYQPANSILALFHLLLVPPIYPPYSRI